MLQTTKTLVKCILEKFAMLTLSLSDITEEYLAPFRHKAVLGATAANQIEFYKIYAVYNHLLLDI